MKNEREKRKLWAVSDETVKLVDAYSCKPSKPDTWWCPEVGFSGTIGFHIFEDKRDAYDIAIEECEYAIEKLYKSLARLKRESRK